MVRAVVAIDPTGIVNKSIPDSEPYEQNLLSYFPFLSQLFILTRSKSIFSDHAGKCLLPGLLCTRLVVVYMFAFTLPHPGQGVAAD